MPWPKHFGSKEIIVKLRDFLILAGSVAAASHVSALSLGNTQGQVQLGSPIDLVFPIQPDAGQTADSSCITAEIWMGNAALTGSQVLVTAQDKSVRVRSTAPVYEPLITLKLRAGCANAVSRSYTFFADPPKSLAASVEPIDLSTIQASPPAATAVTAVRPAAVKNTAAANKAPRVAKKAVNPTAALAQPLAPAAAAAAQTVIAEPVAPKESTQEAATAPASAEKSRLRIEPLDGLDTPPESTPPNQGEAQSFTSAEIDTQTQAILDANQTRLEALEKQLLSMQSQLTSNRAATANLQSQLVQAQNPDLPLWVHILLGLLALALATIAWLLQRIKKERQTAQSSWANTVLAVEDSLHAASVDTRPTASVPALHEAERQSTPPASAFSAVEAGPADTRTSGTDTQPAPALPDLEEADFYAAFEQPASPPPAAEQAPPLPSIAEVLTAQALFDVQEQAEFYASIGENDQAIQILQAHIAEHAASAPLAYIELLQLLYRLSRTEAFEEVREKFEAHFNVQVPNFLGFSRKGRDLSAYPEVLGQIEALWPTDEVQGLMRDLIVRRPAPNHTETNTRFDLAAFDDLLMLYNVAQTTPASSRGQLPGRVRMTPLEVPLPELAFDSPPAPAMQSSNSPGPTATLASAPLPLHEAHLDMLTATPMHAPLPASSLQNDSPFQSPAHFAPSEVLVDDLSLDWDTSKTEAPPTPATDSLSIDEEIDFFTMDERDLPASPPRDKGQ